MHQQVQPFSPVQLKSSLQTPKNLRQELSKPPQLPAYTSQERAEAEEEEKLVARKRGRDLGGDDKSMSVTGTSVAAAATMLAAAAAIFITFVICFYLFLCAKRYRGAAPTIGGGGGGADGRGRGPRFVFGGPCHGSGLDESAIVALPRREVAPGDPAADCAVCITELAAGEAARLLPRCGHAFHVECVDMWLRSHSTCPLCRCAVADEAPTVQVQPPEADPESPNFPTNVLFFGSQDAVTTGGAPSRQAVPPPTQPAQGPIAGVAAVVEAARVAALRRLLGCGGGGGGATPPPAPTPQVERDVEMGLPRGESSARRPAKPQPGS